MMSESKRQINNKFFCRSIESHNFLYYTSTRITKTTMDNNNNYMIMTRWCMCEKCIVDVGVKDAE